MLNIGLAEIATARPAGGAGVVRAVWLTATPFPSHMVPALVTPAEVVALVVLALGLTTPKQPTLRVALKLYR